LRQFLKCGALLGLVLICAACERSQEPGQSPFGNTAHLTIEYMVMPSILMEAETGTVTAPVEVFEDEAASGGKYILAPEGPDHKEISVGGDVACQFNVAEAGEYLLWLRAKWCCSCGDSVGIMLDGVEAGTVQDSVTGVWHWVALQRRRLDLSVGDHTLVLTNREDGAAVDQILLTQDREYRPMDIEGTDVDGRISAQARAE